METESSSVKIDNKGDGGTKILSVTTAAITGRIQIGTRTKHQTNVDDSMTINRIPIERIALMFSFYSNFNINVLSNIL